MISDLSRHNLSEIVINTKYARFIEDKGRRETWEEIIDRNMGMHIRKYPHMEQEIRGAYEYVLDKRVFPSMRSLQFGSKPIELAPNRLYNCCYCPIDSQEAFSEVMFLLLGGSGVGYSVQRHHVRQLPEIRIPKKTRRYLIDDSIAGWADAVKVLFKAYMGDRKARPIFDFSDIRKKGTPLKTSGGKAPGPEPLKTALFKVEQILSSKKEGGKLTPLECHDILCHIADAVLSGGIRRAAMICLFSLKDEDMLTCKSGNFRDTNPQRERANNSAVVVRHKVKKKDFLKLFEAIKASGSGEPGVYFTNDKDVGLNPCGEISLYAFQFCNLVTVKTDDIETQEELERRVIVAAFIGTLQAGYTDFHYLRDVWKEQTEKEALLGIGLSGVATGKVLSLNLANAASVAIEENKRVAELIKINPAARLTCIKPDGTVALVAGTSSGVHAWHAPYYIKRMELLKNEPLAQYLIQHHPALVEEHIGNSKQIKACFPIKAPDSAITREESALDLLERVKKLHIEWVQPGHVIGDNTHNVSCSVTVKPDEWDNVAEWMWENREHYAALAVFPYSDYVYIQPPLEEISKEKYEEMMKHMLEVDLSQINEHEDNTKLQGELACAGGACEI